MGIQGPIPIANDVAFACGVCAITVGPVYDFDRSTKDVKVQAVDKNSLLPVWGVEVIDMDENTRSKDRAFTVKIAAEVQPMPPPKMPGMPLRPVEFEGLAVRPYVNANGRIAWSYSAKGMRAPQTGSKPRATTADNEGRAA